MIIGVESSCDESALALFDPQRGLQGEWVYSQVPQHQPYGGIVPDLASREHMRNFPPLAQQLLADYLPHDGDTIAVTAGPGLAGCLALGLAFASALGLRFGVPVVGVNHLRGHLFSPFIGLHGDDPAAFQQRLREHLPHLGLIVSGGNTLLCHIDSALQVTVVAQTVDDAAGEALDKGAKLLGMPYPGGPLIEKAAAAGDARAFAFPRAFAHSADARFSFSGLKTSLRYQLEKMSSADVAAAKADLCASYQQAVVDALVAKTKQQMRGCQLRSIGLSGGVANNGRLRDAMEALAQRQQLPLLCARRAHCGDNAAMIAFAAWLDPAAVINGPSSFLPAWELT